MTSRRLGVGLTPMETRRDVILHVAERAERLGYDSFSVAEGWGHDASVLLAEIATRTQRITLGTGILNPWGRSAATIAMLATSLSELTGGRFFLGLGAGSPPLAEGLHDVEFEQPVGRLSDVTRQVRRLLEGQRLEPSVERATRPLRLAVTPRHEVPVHLAAMGPRSVRQAGEIADGWLPFLLPLSGLGAGTRQLQEGADRSGRARPMVAPCIPAAVSADPETASAMASWWVAFYLTSMGPLYRQTLTRLGHGRAVEDVVAANPTGRTTDVPESARGLFDEVLLWGTPDQATEALGRWYAAGAELPTVVLPPGRPVDELDAMLEALASSRRAPGAE